MSKKKSTVHGLVPSVPNPKECISVAKPHTGIENLMNAQIVLSPNGVSHDLCVTEYFIPTKCNADTKLLILVATVLT